MCELVSGSGPQDKDYIKTDFAVDAPFACIMVRSRYQSSDLASGDTIGGSPVKAKGTGLNLHDNKDRSNTCNNVDLCFAIPVIPAQNFIALRTQIGYRLILSPETYFRRRFQN